MKSKTLSLLALSGVIMIATIFTSAYWDEMGLGENKMPLAVTTIIAFSISLAGLIVGSGEKKTLKTILGLVGHSIVVAFFIIIVVYSTTL